MKPNIAGTSLREFKPYCSVRKSIGKFLLVALTLLFGFAGNAQEDKYLEITAVIWSTSWRDGVQTNRVTPIRCIIGKDRWLIEGHFMPPSPDTLYSFYSDGTNIYKSAVALSSPSGAYLHITPGNHPISGITTVHIPWLAFASGRYLSERNRIVPNGLMLIRRNINSLGLEDQTEIFNDELGLPKSVSLYTSQEVLRESLWDTRFARADSGITTASGGRIPISVARQNSEILETVSPENGLMKSQYTVISTTNIFGWNIPLEFKYLDYDLNADGTTRLRLEAIGKINEIWKTNALAGVPYPDIERHVKDYRFRHPHKMLEMIRYTSTPANILPVDDPKLEDIYKKAVDDAQLDPRYGKWHPIRLIYEAAEKIEKLVE